MINTHLLEAELHSEFLKQGRIDPITGEQIEEGHTIVICSACKSAFFIESWEYLEQNHCNQSETLIELPKPKNLFLVAKPLEYLPFLFKKGNQDVDSTIHSIFENAIVTAMVLLGFICVVIFSFFIGFLTNPIGGVLACFGALGGISFFLNQKKSRTLLKREIKETKGVYISLDTKKQGITIKKKNNLNTIKFDEIKELHYFVEYLSATITNDYNQCALSVQIITSKNKTQKYYTLLHIDELPNWSQFLEKLPYNLKVLNLK